MSSKTVSVAVCCCPRPLLFAASAIVTPLVAVAVVARILKQLKVSDQQLI